MHISFASIARRKFAIIFGSIVFVVLILISWLVYDIVDTRRVDAEAVTLKDDLTLEFGDAAKASDFVANLNGEYLNDPEINATQLGPQEVEFEFKNLKNRKRTRKITVEVIDTTAPLIYGRSFYSVPVNYAGTLTDLMLSGDNIDDHPAREIRGTYNLAEAGNYDLEYIITDASGNTATQPFTLQVYIPEPATENPNPSTPSEIIGFPIADAISQYKNGNTAVGIDVSSWQGDIDWRQVKSAGVEFAIIRLGYQADYGSEYTLDQKFTQNIEGAIAVGLPVGVYFYSCADSVDEAHRQAEWVIEQTKDYRLELGISFDWEEWSDFNRAGMSFYTLQKSADVFLEDVENAGYRGLLYGSKNYLDKFWQHNHHDVWLAQYYDYPTYAREFKLWQFTDSGQVPGIAGFVDLDVKYENNF